MNGFPYAWLLCASIGLGYAADAAQARRQDEKARLRYALQRAGAAVEAQSWDEARSAYRVALDIDPENRNAREGLRESQYQSLFQKGVKQESAGRMDDARRSFADCVLFRPEDEHAAQKLAAVTAHLARAERDRNAKEAAFILLRTGKWRKLDLDLKAALAAGQSAPAGKDVFSPLLESARGNPDVALQLLKAPHAAGDPALWRLAMDYVASRRRLWYARHYAAPLGALYASCLLVVTFLGLKWAAKPEDA
jgi:tetratricopeptide (TPR) repeat protein